MDKQHWIDPREVRKRYDRLDAIWAREDPWHFKVSQRYDQEILGFLRENDSKDLTVINIGSGDKIYKVSSFLINMDISEKFLSRHVHPVCASAMSIPFAEEALDATICIGSVINYCDAVQVISEIGRVLKSGGKAFVEFESSESFEYCGTNEFGKLAVIVKTKYGNNDETIWLYKPDYIEGLLSSSGIRVLSAIHVHVLSSILYRWVKIERISSAFCIFDKILAKTPLKKYAANVIFVCQKI